MIKFDDIFSFSPESVYPSNTPFEASEIPGWLCVEKGEIHIFLTRRERGESGKRYFVTTLCAGDAFPACPVLKSQDGTGIEYGYLLVPRMPSTCRNVPAEDFSRWLNENQTEKDALLNHLVSSLSSAYIDSEEVIRCADVLTLPETLQKIIQKTHESIARREQNEAKIAEDEKTYQQSRSQAQFAKLQDIVQAQQQKQYKTNDPLLAALQIIAGEYGLSIHIDLSNDPNMDFESKLVEFCLSNQWRTRRIVLESGFSNLQHGTIIGFHAEEGRPCILELRGSDSVWYFPGSGEKHPLTPKTESQLQNIAYCFYESFPKRPLMLRDVVNFIFKGSKKVFLCTFAVGILVGLFGLVTPVATAYVTGKIIPTANLGELYQLLILLLALTTGTVILNVVPRLCLLLFGSSVLERFLAALFDRIFRLPVYFFHKYSAGDLCTRLLAAIQLQELTFQVVSQQFISSLFSLTSLILLFYYSWKLTLIALPLVLLYVFTLYYLFTRLREPLRTAADRGGWEAGFLKQVLDGIAKIRGAGAELRVENHFLGEFEKEKRARFQFVTGVGKITILGVIMPALINMIFFYLIGKTWRGTLEVSGFLAFLTAYGSFQAGVIAIGEALWQLASQKPELERLKVFWSSDVEAPAGKPLAEKLDGSVEFSHITFGYSPDAPPVLRDISMSIAPGEFVAIVGSSGAGKSSLIRLLLGFEIPSKGSILYSGQELRNLDINSVRRQLGVILQNSRIMPGSILDNIATGTSCTEEQVEKAARMAALDKDIAAMPMGIHTNVGDGLISGGQQQRILIARALLGNPAILIMDESTSALDNETQEIVRRNIEKLNVTRIIIAHRLSTIINADRIYVLDKGQVAESGTFEELMSHDGLFRKLAQRQML